jgi:predicted DNA-binding ribbon-helix-helix protein
MTRAGREGEGKRRDVAARLLTGWDVSTAGRPQKHSVAIAGHRTSISLEEPFWRGLREIARAEGVPLAALIDAIDKIRGEVSLSSALRLFVFARHGGQPAATRQRIEPAK